MVRVEVEVEVLVLVQVVLVVLVQEAVAAVTVVMGRKCFQVARALEVGQAGVVMGTTAAPPWLR